LNLSYEVAASVAHQEVGANPKLGGPIKVAVHSFRDHQGNLLATLHISRFALVAACRAGPWATGSIADEDGNLPIQERRETVALATHQPEGTSNH
jgi:hypothetical protein